MAGRGLRFWRHVFGLSFLGGAVFVELFVFVSILDDGVFVAVEGNPWVLFIEILLAVGAMEYLIFLFSKLGSLP